MSDDFGDDDDYSSSNDNDDSDKSDEESSAKFSDDDSDAERAKQEAERKKKEEEELKNAPATAKKKKQEEPLTIEEKLALREAEKKKKREAEAAEDSDSSSVDPDDPLAKRFTEDNRALFGDQDQQQQVPVMPVMNMGKVEVQDFPLVTKEDYKKLANLLGKKVSKGRPTYILEFLKCLLTPTLRKLDTGMTNEIFEQAQTAWRIKHKADVDAKNKKKKKKRPALGGGRRAQTSYDPNYRDGQINDGDFDDFM